MIFADLPYGTTACKWDSVIPFEPLWAELNRVAKPNAAMVFTACQPFTSALVASNLKAFRYTLVWDKVNRYTGSLNARRQPLRRHEDVVVFYRRQPTYNRQMREGPRLRNWKTNGFGKHVGGAYTNQRREYDNGGLYNPHSIIAIEAQVGRPSDSLHPTQKPVALMDYLIATYSNPGDVILDPTMGSGSTGVAALNLSREFIGIERDPTYFATAESRLKGAV